MNRGNISFSHTEGRVRARTSKRHNVLFMQPGRTVREGCWWSGKWHTATAYTKLTALPGQLQLSLTRWPIFPISKKEVGGRAKKKAPHPCCLVLAKAMCIPLTLPSKSALPFGGQKRECWWQVWSYCSYPVAHCAGWLGIGVTGGESVQMKRCLAQKRHRTCLQTNEEQLTFSACL